MKTIGFIGGMSWESTAHYYALVNKYIQEELGGLHSAKLLLYSVDFAEIEALQRQGSWDDVAASITEAAQRLEEAGADFIVICTNTIHKIVPVMESQIDIPILHIADAAGEALIADGISKVGLLGTAYTLRDNFYQDRLAQYGVETLIPEDEDIDLLNEMIFDELCKGEVRLASKVYCKEIIRRLAKEGAQAVLLACTELDLLIREDVEGVPVFDTTEIHAKAAAEKAMESESCTCKEVCGKISKTIIEN